MWIAAVALIMSAATPRVAYSCIFNTFFLLSNMLCLSAANQLELQGKNCFLFSLIYQTKRFSHFDHFCAIDFILCYFVFILRYSIILESTLALRRHQRNSIFQAAQALHIENVHFLGKWLVQSIFISNILMHVLGNINSAVRFHIQYSRKLNVNNLFWVLIAPKISKTFAKTFSQ